MKNETQKEWIAFFTLLGVCHMSLEETEAAANARLDACSGMEDCYEVATYHVPTKTLRMRDPLSAHDPGKVQTAIERLLGRERERIPAGEIRYLRYRPPQN
jgi:hypothetical protein